MLTSDTRALLLAFAAIWLLPSLVVAQDLATSKEKQMKIAGADGEPSFVLHISANGRQGAVSVRDESGTEIQSLVCPLLRDNSAATEPELAAVREQFVLRFEAPDLDFDGHKDLMGIRDFGAKWARYCVWFYNPQRHLFVTDFLAQQMELLANLTPGGNGQIITWHLGPTNPWLAIYRIASSSGSRPERQLVPTYSCLVETAADGDTPKTVVTTRYESGQPIVRRQGAAKMRAASALEFCSLLAKLPETPNSPAKK